MQKNTVCCVYFFLFEYFWGPWSDFQYLDNGSNTYDSVETNNDAPWWFRNHSVLTAICMFVLSRTYFFHWLSYLLLLFIRKCWLLLLFACQFIGLNHSKLLSRTKCVIGTGCQRHLMSAIICYDMVLWEIERYGIFHAFQFFQLWNVHYTKRKPNASTRMQVSKLQNQYSKPQCVLCECIQ